MTDYRLSPNHLWVPTAGCIVLVLSLSACGLSPSTNAPAPVPNIAIPAPTANANTVPVAPNMNAPAPSVVLPLEDFFSRVTKKPFGIFITPSTSPVQPEVFHGYHTGADAETMPEEQTIDIPVRAIADGTVTRVAVIRGYGGVVMIRHTVGDETVTALYGHLRLSSVTLKQGDAVHVGDTIAVLGTGFTTETANERKHLHFGLRDGVSTETRGYVSRQSDLAAWLDPVAWLQAHGA